MSEDSGEKKYDASQKKLQDQRQKGQVAQSQDIGKLLALTAISEIALLSAHSSMQRLEQLLMLPVSLIGQPFSRSLQAVIAEAGYVFFGFALLMTGTAIVMKLISSWLQFGFLFAPEVLVPDFNRLNPFNQAKQMFSAQSLMTLLTGLIKALLICVVLYLVIGPSLDALVGLVNADLPGYIDALITLFRYLLHVCLGLLLVLALVRDTHNQLHSAPLTDTPSQEPGWNLSDVLFKVIDKGVPEPGLRALANAVDLGQRGKVALEGNTLLCWDSQAQQWEKTDYLNVDQLERGLDGRAYVLQAGQLQELATHKSRGPVYMDASYDLAPPEGARTYVTLSSGASVKGEWQITGFAVENAKRFVTLDQDNQLHAHVDGAERVLSFTLPKALKALALDRRGDLYAQSRTGELLKLEKAHWQSPSSTAKTWEAVKLPGNECLKSLRMGPDKQLIASWGENDPQQNRWGEIFRQLVVSPDGQPKWEAPAPPKAGDSSLNSVLSGGEIKSQNNGTAWAVTSTVLGHKAEGLERDRGLLSGIGAHIKPLEGLKNIGLDIQHHFKGRAGLAGLYADDRALRGQLDALAKAAPCTTNMTTRLERLSEQQSTQALAGALKHALGQVEKNSESLAIRLGDIKGARVIPEQAVAAVDHSAKRSAFSLNQMRQAFERGISNRS